MKKWIQAKENQLLLAAGGTLLAAGLGAFWYASRVEIRRYKLESVTVPTTYGGAGIMPNLKILHISDLHLCQPESHKIEFLQRITDEDYDMVVLTGDVFENFSGLEYASQILKRKPRLGAYAVLGNHDYYEYTMWNKVVGRIARKFRHPSRVRNVDSMVAALEHAGFTVLQNSWCSHPEERISVIGVDYFAADEDSFKAMIANVPDDHLLIGLKHVPHKLRRLSEAGIDVLFCGHTHGGQVRLPGFGAIITDSELPREEACGLIWRDKTAVHVSRGVGADPRSNFRFFCPPHATLVTVQRTRKEDGVHTINIEKRKQLQKA